MDSHLNNSFYWYSKLWSGTYNRFKVLRSEQSCNFPNPTRQCNECQTITEEIEKCLDEGLEQTYYFSIFIFVG